MSAGHQPGLHDLVTVLCAPNVAISSPEGQVGGEGVQGIYCHDRRTLARLEFGVREAGLVSTGVRIRGAGHACFHGIVRPFDDRAQDPTVRYVRERQVTGECVRETWTLHNHRESTVDVDVTMTAATDLARIDVVKAATPTSAVEPSANVEGAQWNVDGATVRLVLDQPAQALSSDACGVTWSWRVAVPAGGTWTLLVDVVQQEDPSSSAFLPRRPQSPIALTVPESQVGGDDDAQRLLDHSLRDLDGLLLADPEQPDSAFLAAGSPWFFTLFGRDSLWSARFLLPLSTELAAGTLRALAARQGTCHDALTEEQPGKIPHELRRVAIDIDDGDGGKRLYVPPLYYGTVDATALWVCLLHDSWRAGLAESEVIALLPALRAALDWIVGPGDPDGDGFCEYQGSAGHGLANQGWKDSADGVRWADGSVARRPLALCEVQGYAYEAAVGGAELLEAFAEDGNQWRKWAARLRERFRDSFWVSDEHGRYPAIALDADKRPVTGPASNMAHLLGTGLLDDDESSLVATQLASPALDSGYGLRTMSAQCGGFNPLSYHCGSVWPHDTAIAVLGLAAEGHHEQAQALAQGLLRAGARFDYRMPELYGGTDHRTGDPPIAYPAACRPQAWSAAGAVAVVGYLQGWPSSWGSEKYR